MDSLLSVCAFLLTCVCVSADLSFLPDVRTPKRVKDWDEVVLVRPNSNATLPCTHTHTRLAPDETLNWQVRPLGEAQLTPLLTANHRTEFLHRGRGWTLADRKYAQTGNLSLRLVATETAVGLYWCIVERGVVQAKTVVLLALLHVTVVPESPVPQDSTVVLSARVTPPYAISTATWLSPTGSALRSEALAPPAGGHLTKLPRFSLGHQGTYTYFAQHYSHTHRNAEAQISVTVTLNMSAVVEFPNPTFEMAQALVCQSRAVVRVKCPAVLGDYLLLYWRQADAHSPTLAYEHDRWRQTSTNHTQLRLRLQGPTPLVAGGNYSFLFTPEQKQGGVFRCEVFLNDHAYVQETQLTVIHVFAKWGVSEVQLWCLLCHVAQLERVTWTGPRDPLRPDASIPGRLGISVPLPVRTNTAGNYTCTAHLPSGQSAAAVYTLSLPPTGETTAVYTVTLPPAVYMVTLPPTGDTSTESPHGSIHPLLLSLSALLLPVMSLLAGGLLWRRRRSINRHGVELSSYCGEVENIYENPEDVRQPAQGVYMDLKPTGEDSVYKELDRYDQNK